MTKVSFRGGAAGSAAAPMKEEGENCDEGEGSSSATPKTAAAPPSGRVSPICQSPIPGGCVDPRVYTSKFGEQADAWHQNKSTLLMIICEAIGRHRGQRNLALAGVRLVYKQGEEEGEFRWLC